MAHCTHWLYGSSLQYLTCGTAFFLSFSAACAGAMDIAVAIKAATANPRDDLFILSPPMCIDAACHGAFELMTDCKMVARGHARATRFYGRGSIHYGQ